MRSASAKYAAAILLYLWLPLVLIAQSSTSNSVESATATGQPAFGSFGGGHESINVSNGNVHLELPLVTLPGRSGKGFTLSLVYDSAGWYVEHFVIPGVTDQFLWTQQSHAPFVDGSWHYNIPTLTATQTQIDANLGGHWCYTNFVLTTGDGTQHWSKNKAYCYHYNPASHALVMDPSYQINTGGDMAAAYVTLDTTSVVDAVARLKDGTAIHFSPQYMAGTPGADFVSVQTLANKLVDTDGNTVNIQGDYSSGLTSITDTLGRSITTTSSSIGYKDSGGIARTISLGYTSYTSHPVFTAPAADLGTSTAGGLGSVTLPNNLKYSFQYGAYSELTQITYPTGGYTRYDYASFSHWKDSNLDDLDARMTTDIREVTARHVCRSSSGTCSIEDTTTYTPTIDGLKTNNQYMDVVDPDGNKTHYQFSFHTNGDTPKLYNYFSPRELTRSMYAGSSTLLRSIQTDYDQLDSLSRPSTLSKPIRVTTTLNDTNQVTKVETDYSGQADDPSEVREYAYGTGAAGALIRKTDYTWLKVNPVNSIDYTTTTAINILNRKATEKVYDSASNLVAQSQFEYDKYDTSANHATLQASGAVQHDSAFGTSYTTRGHVTMAQHWRNTDGTWLSAFSQFDDAGNVLKSIDFGGHATTFSFTDSWSNSTCAPTGGSAKAYATTVANALSQSATAVYNSCSGTAASTTDANSQIVSNSYDLMGRVTQTNLPDSGLVTRTFNEASMPLSFSALVKITAAANLTPPVVVDGLGRITQSQLTSDPEGTTYVDTTYDAEGRKKTVSNPYRAGDTIYVTTYNYDALGRVIQVIPPDGTSSSNNVTTSYSGNCATVTDQTGKKRKTCNDAQGRLIQVFEPDSGQNLVNETDYQYDVLNNLLCVHQRGTDVTADKVCTDGTVPASWHPRKFTYNSLSQLLTSTNPESGTITYTYDADGNVATKQDARAITTTYFYDVLHRLTKKTYSDTTPQVIYGYDGIAPTGCTPPTLTITNGVGRRTSMCDAAGSEAWSYDQMGRVLTEKRTTNSVTKTTSYTYNYDGSLATITYPSGRVVTYTPSAAGRTLSAVDTANSINYATAALYSAFGAPSSFQNGAGIVSTFYYNQRLQSCRVSVKTSGTAPTQCSDTAHLGNLLDLTYDYNLSVANNGNVKQITNNLNANRTQAFTYDEMNRMKTALTQGTSGSLCWGLDYSYDIYANLQGVALDANRPSCTWTNLSIGIDTNNRVTSAGFSYDAAGNVLSDGSFSYTWDAESELKAAASITYTYDGDGRRVQKSNGKLYWYGATGDILDESDASGNITDEFVFFGGKRIARRNISTGNIYYHLADHLGTARMIVQAGATTACYDADFDPFGGEHIITNTCPQNYKFTGKERDAESGLDDFEARYYSSQFGRFHSADWSAIPAPVPYADIANPQTLNLYAYVKNNPLNLTDPTGHLATGQLGSSDGMSIVFRMHPGDGIAEAMENFDPPTEAALEAMAVNNAAAIAGLIAQQQGNQPATSIDLLGRTVGITYSARLSDAERLAASDKLTAAAAKVNENATKIDAEDKTAISKISAITVDNTARTGIDSKSGVFNFRTTYLAASGVPWLASTLFHDGYHVIQRQSGQRYTPQTAEAMEHEANLVQARVGLQLGLNIHEIVYLLMDKHTAYNTEAY